MLGFHYEQSSKRSAAAILTGSLEYKLMLTLREKSTAFEGHFDLLTFDQYTPEHRKIDPSGTSAALVQHSRWG
jgi:hypothetical protein